MDNLVVLFLVLVSFFYFLIVLCYFFSFRNALKKDVIKKDNDLWLLKYKVLCEQRRKYNREKFDRDKLNLYLIQCKRKK